MSHWVCVCEPKFGGCVASSLCSSIRGCLLMILVFEWVCVSDPGAPSLRVCVFESA